MFKVMTKCLTLFNLAPSILFSTQHHSLRYGVDPTDHDINIFWRFPGQSQPNHPWPDAVARVSSNGEKLQHTSISKTILLPFTPAADAQNAAKKRKSVCTFINRLMNSYDVMKVF